jgi:hypothetical protein
LIKNLVWGLIALERMKKLQLVVLSPATFYFEKGLDVKYAKWTCQPTNDIGVH